MDKEQIKVLLEKYNNGEATHKEKALLETWYLNYNAEIPVDLASDEIEQDIDDIYNLLPQPKRTIKIWPRIVAAASILLFLAIGSYFIWNTHTRQQFAQKQKYDIAPGGNKATLMLANGTQIILTDVKNGKLAQQGNTTISKTVGGGVVYDASVTKARNQPTETAYNVMTTPRGGQYHLTLADGTNVWLNTASSIKYPTTFTGKERKVEITGEVYFEVAHNAAMPFRVSSKGQIVEVLGTHFNINAYDDEPLMKTTLLEGSVKVSRNGAQALLKPGEQAQTGHDKISIVDDADTEEAIAWHKGLFKFNDADIQTVMRQLSRWYDVDVSYEGKIPDRRFSGKIYQNVSALKVSDILSYKKIHFKIEGKKIIVIP
ncbi:MAG: fec operon regulator FecR [Mucilaginibacter sp.]|nr:fec operon regulator FecR [Mucilaginibacter sp.]